MGIFIWLLVPLAVGHIVNYHKTGRREKLPGWYVVAIAGALAFAANALTFYPSETASYLFPLSFTKGLAPYLNAGMALQAAIALAFLVAVARRNPPSEWRTVLTWTLAASLVMLLPLYQVNHRLALADQTKRRMEQSQAEEVAKQDAKLGQLGFARYPNAQSESPAPGQVIYESGQGGMDNVNWSSYDYWFMTGDEPSAVFDFYRSRAAQQGMKCLDGKLTRELSGYIDGKYTTVRGLLCLKGKSALLVSPPGGPIIKSWKMRMFFADEWRKKVGDAEFQQAIIKGMHFEPDK